MLTWSFCASGDLKRKKINRDLDLGLVRSQAELYGRISRAYENLKKTSATKLTLGVVQARLPVQPDRGTWDPPLLDLGCYYVYNISV